MDGDTIYAPATAPGRAGIAVLRLSGPAAGAALERLTGTALPPPRRASLRRFADPESGELIDRGLALWLPGPASFTGEDMAELHLHGGRAVLDGLLRALARGPGLRLAVPGEFTRRAFEHGRLDLTEAEAIADLVAAETAGQRRQALRQLSGALGELYEGWRATLLRAQAALEAAIDFPEEGLPSSLLETVRAGIAAVAEAADRHLADGRRGERLREGVSVAVVGPPNAGKSSLLNWLARREAAIVSATAGTTRDIIEVHLDLGGSPVVLADTAGLREAADEIEAEGVRRAQARAAAADLRLVVLDATQPDMPPEVAAQLGAGSLVVTNKTDLAPGTGGTGLPVSVKTGAGLPVLLRRLEEEVAGRLDTGGAPALTRARHRDAVIECRGALRRADVGLQDEAGAELVAEDLRLAIRALGRITGRVDVEDMLDALFAEFCIGK